MAKMLVISLFSFVVFSVLVEGHSLDLMEKELQKDKAVREMLSLVNVRKQLKSLKESTMQQIVITEGPSSKLDEEIDSQDGGIVSHNQLCSDAVTYLQAGSEAVDKRDLVINYVFNYCVKPSSSNNEILDYLNALSALSNEMGDDSDLTDWPNWPGFDSVTTPRPPVPTTVDFWQLLIDELFPEDEATTQVPTTTDWWSLLFDDLFSDDDDDDDLRTTNSAETTTVTSPVSSTEEFDVDAALEAFFELIAEENQESDSTTPKVSTPAAVEMVASTEEPTLDEDLQALLDMLESQENKEEEEEEVEEEEEEGNIFGAIWDLISSDDVDEEIPENVDNDGNEESNDLPPVFVNKRLVMKKRLLSLLAESLMEKREEAMRK